MGFEYQSTQKDMIRQAPQCPSSRAESGVFPPVGALAISTQRTCSYFLLPAGDKAQVQGRDSHWVGVGAGLLFMTLDQYLL